MMGEDSKQKESRTEKAPTRKVIAVGKWNGTRWVVRTNIWRYLASYAMSKS